MSNLFLLSNPMEEAIYHRVLLPVFDDVIATGGVKKDQVYQALLLAREAVVAYREARSRAAGEGAVLTEVTEPAPPSGGEGPPAPYRHPGGTIPTRPARRQPVNAPPDESTTP